MLNNIENKTYPEMLKDFGMQSKKYKIDPKTVESIKNKFEIIAKLYKKGIGYNYIGKILTGEIFIEKEKLDKFEKPRKMIDTDSTQLIIVDYLSGIAVAGDIMKDLIEDNDVGATEGRFYNIDVISDRIDMYCNLFKFGGRKGNFTTEDLDNLSFYLRKQYGRYIDISSSSKREDVRSSIASYKILNKLGIKNIPYNVMKTVEDNYKWLGRMDEFKSEEFHYKYKLLFLEGLQTFSSLEVAAILKSGEEATQMYANFYGWLQQIGYDLHGNEFVMHDGSTKYLFESIMELYEAGQYKDKVGFYFMLEDIFEKKAKPHEIKKIIEHINRTGKKGEYVEFISVVYDKYEKVLKTLNYVNWMSQGGSAGVLKTLRNAIRNKKTKFADIFVKRLLAGEIGTGENILFSYSDRIDLNDINEEDFQILINTSKDKWKCNSDYSGIVYKSKEFMALIEKDNNFILAYNRLHSYNVSYGNRLKMIGEMTNIGKEINYIIEKMDILLPYFKNRTMSEWRDVIFPGRKIGIINTMKFLVTFGEETAIEMAKEANKDSDVNFILNNLEDVKELGLDGAIEKFAHGSEFEGIMRLMKVENKEEFVEENMRRISNFVGSGNYDIYKTYDSYLYSTNQSPIRENLQKITKAELYGKLGIIKYGPDGNDIDNEIKIETSPTVKAEWMKPFRYKQISEMDDYASTLTFGNVPTSTCMSYASGSSRKALLSHFDSNKKIAFVLDGEGNKISRSIIRLTRTYHNAPPIEVNNDIKFIDIEEHMKLEKSGGKNVFDGVEEIAGLTMFVERMYTSKTSDLSAVDSKALIEYAFLRSRDLGCRLSFASCFNLELKRFLRNNGFLALDETIEIETLSEQKQNEKVRIKETYFWVSKSKNGAQYLDSFGGSASTETSATFKKTNLVIIEPEVVREIVERIERNN